jgi:hypothetical protein
LKLIIPQPGDKWQQLHHQFRQVSQTTFLQVVILGQHQPTWLTFGLYAWVVAVVAVTDGPITLVAVAALDGRIIYQ